MHCTLQPSTVGSSVDRVLVVHFLLGSEHVESSPWKTSTRNSYCHFDGRVTCRNRAYFYALFLPIWNEYCARQPRTFSFAFSLALTFACANA